MLNRENNNLMQCPHRVILGSSQKNENNNHMHMLIHINDKIEECKEEISINNYNDAFNFASQLTKKINNYIRNQIKQLC